MRQRAIHVLRNAMGGGGGKKRYEGVRLNIISVMRGWVGVKFRGKKRYVTLEWPPSCTHVSDDRLLVHNLPISG